MDASRRHSHEVTTARHHHDTAPPSPRRHAATPPSRHTPTSLISPTALCRVAVVSFFYGRRTAVSVLSIVDRAAGPQLSKPARLACTCAQFPSISDHRGSDGRGLVLWIGGGGLAHSPSASARVPSLNRKPAFYDAPASPAAVALAALARHFFHGDFRRAVHAHFTRPRRSTRAFWRRGQRTGRRLKARTPRGLFRSIEGETPRRPSVCLCGAFRHVRPCARAPVWCQMSKNTGGCSMWRQHHRPPPTSLLTKLSYDLSRRWWCRSA